MKSSSKYEIKLAISALDKTRQLLLYWNKIIFVNEYCLLVIFDFSIYFKKRWICSKSSCNSVMVWIRWGLFLFLAEGLSNLKWVEYFDSQWIRMFWFHVYEESDLSLYILFISNIYQFSSLFCDKGVLILFIITCFYYLLYLLLVYFFIYYILYYHLIIIVLFFKK